MVTNLVEFHKELNLAGIQSLSICVCIISGKLMVTVEALLPMNNGLIQMARGLNEKDEEFIGIIPHK